MMGAARIGNVYGYSVMIDVDDNFKVDRKVTDVHGSSHSRGMPFLRLAAGGGGSQDG